uniref:Uncharacterized protein n=1 Tax=Setaria italica TaxID=4555 RepID=A0A0Q3U9C0_SETIT
PKSYRAPNADSVLCTYLPEIHSLPSPACSEMTGKATARVDGMKWEAEETTFLAEAERAYQAAAWSKILAAQTSAGKQNKALEVLTTDVQCQLNTMESSQKEKMQP